MSRVSPYREPEYKLARMEVLDDEIEIYVIFNKYFIIEFSGDFDDCLYFLESKGIDTTKYREG
jgi:hypothetical protein